MLAAFIWLWSYCKYFLSFCFFSVTQLFADSIQYMEGQRNISEFIFWRLSGNKNIQIFCFVFLFCYIAILVGNLLILVSIWCSPLCHQPMYYFISHLSSMDICYTSCVTPKLISDLPRGRKTIFYGNYVIGLFLALLRNDWNVHPYNHGFWSLGFHLQASPLHDYHEQEKVQYPHPGSLGWWGCPCLFSVLYAN